MPQKDKTEQRKSKNHLIFVKEKNNFQFFNPFQKVKLSTLMDIFQLSSSDIVFLDVEELKLLLRYRFCICPLIRSLEKSQKRSTEKKWSSKMFRFKKEEEDLKIWSNIQK